MLKFILLALVLLFSQGIENVTANSLFVSHHGLDIKDCGNWTKPCRSVRHAVKISNDGDQIYIDYAQGRPYMECEGMPQSTCSIKLAKSVSFRGINGKADIRCTRTCKFFVITSPRFPITRIQFVNLIISSSNTVATLGVGARTELVFENMLIRYNYQGIYSKYSTDCTVKINNSSFERNFDWAIYLQCSNLTTHIDSTTFKLNPVHLTNTAYKPGQKTEILIQKTAFDFQRHSVGKTCVDMVGIKPFATIFNLTITDTVLKNHVAMCQQEDHFSALKIYDRHSRTRNITFIFFSNLLMENNYNNLAALRLIAGYRLNSLVKIVIQSSIFKNNTAALWVSTGGKYISERPTIFLKNNTFVNNIYKLDKPDGAAAVYFGVCKSRVSSCRFLDNKAGPNPYTGVVTISEMACVTFEDSYFENRQTNEHANQLFASGNQPLYFIHANTFNIIALKEGQSLFLRMPSAKNEGVIIEPNFKFLCPQGYKLKLQRRCVFIKKGKMLCYYINIQCNQCPTKTYTLERGKLIYNKTDDIQCEQCPRGGDCDKGLVTAKPNFWGHKSGRKVYFIQCPPGYCCESEDCVTYDSCHGNRSGTLCGQCPEGMSESLLSTDCISNTECSINDFFILGTITMLVLYLIFFLYHKEIVIFLVSSLFSKRPLFSINGENEQRTNLTTAGNASSGIGMIKIFFYYYQVCHLLRSSVGSSKNSEFIMNFENFISRAINMVLVNVPSFNCPLKNLHAVPKAVVVHSVGFCLLGLLCLLYLVSRLFLYLGRIKRGSVTRTALESVTMRTSAQENIASKQTFSQRIASAFTHISLLMYASSTQLCLSLLHCVPVGDSQVLLLDGNIKCHQTFQYFLLAYLISSILPFCLVPVLGSYLLEFSRIGVKQFCAACIFPLPFCCFWMYLLLKDCRLGNQRTYNTIEQSNNAVTNEENDSEGQSGGSEEITSTTEWNKKLYSRRETAILVVLLGPFRSHEAFLCFPSSHIPWEGFLIFRRLVLIIVLTFVYDIQLRLFLALTTCAAILLFHMFVSPFQRKCDNVLESFSLVSHVVLCGLTLNKALYYGEDYSSYSESLPVLNVVENILMIGPLSIIMIVVILCILVKLTFGIKLCVSAFFKKLRRTFSFL